MERKLIYTIFSGIIIVSLVHGSRGHRGKTRWTAFTQKFDEAPKASAPRMKNSNPFPDELQYTMHMEGMGQTELHLVRDLFMGLPETLTQIINGTLVNAENSSKSTEDVAFYTDVNGHGSFACIPHKTAQGKFFCELAALLEVGEETCFIGSGSAEADCTASDTGELKYFDIPPDEHSSWKPAGTATISHEGRKKRSFASNFRPHNIAHERLKRSILPEPGHKTVEIAFMLDYAVMSIFYQRHPNDVAAAEKEARLYVTLLTIEMNVYLSTIKEVSDGDIDIYAYPTDIVFPPTGQDFLWAIDYRDGTVLRADVNFDVKLRQTVNSGFTQKQWDHVMVLTGLDLFDEDTGSNSLLGYAYRSTICYPRWHYYAAYQYSINEVQTYNIGRIAAHELGHALGMTHDEGDPCPRDVNIMSPSIFNPDSSSRSTYFKFSTCSVDELTGHLNRMPSCTVDNSFTQRQFEEFFCSGLPGSQENSLDRQCQRVTGWTGSKACNTLSSGKDCYARYRVRCSLENGYCGAYLKYVWNGTPCGTDKVCFQGKCRVKFDVCDQEATTSTTSSTSASSMTSSSSTSSSTSTSTTSSTTSTSTTSTTTTSSTTSTSTTSTSTTSSTTTTPATTSTSTTEEPVIAPCSCCGFQRNKRRQRCCRTGRKRETTSCYCCRELRDVEPPKGFDGPTYNED